MKADHQRIDRPVLCTVFDRRLSDEEFDQACREVVAAGGCVLEKKRTEVRTVITWRSKDSLDFIVVGPFEVDL